MKRKSVILLAVLVPWAVFCADASHWNVGRTPPQHLLAPLDAHGDKVSTRAAFPRPISQKETCAQCHDVASMKGASHFRTGLDVHEATPSVTVEPWFWADDATGLAVPLSLHGQQGSLRPCDVGLSCWQWTKLMGRSFPGGGIADDPRAHEEVAGPRQRWMVTGGLSMNCLACHQQKGYDLSEWARQVARENWQGAASAASGLAQVEGMNERLDSTWNPEMRPENPDDHLFKVPEKTVYDLSRFDEKGRCLFDVGKPQNANCLACHSVTPTHMRSHEIAGDVHLSRGMTCVSCHQNGMNHHMRVTTCAACHTGAKGAGPRPRHVGLPLVHFEKLSCTVCHAGVTQDGKRDEVRTSRANRIGIYGRAQWGTDTPRILEPVFVKEKDGVIRPHRMMWPSGFRRQETNGTLRVISPEEAANWVKVCAPTSTHALAQILKPLDRAICFLSSGLLYSLNEKGELVTKEGVKEVAPVSWPVGHDVRPAHQARGAAPAKCADCHSTSSTFFTDLIVPVGPLMDATPTPLRAADLLGVGEIYHRFLGTTFALRPLLKVFLWSVFALLCLFVAAVAAQALVRLTHWISEETRAFAWELFAWLVQAAFLVCLIYLALSGVMGWFAGGMTSWWIVLHMIAGGVLAGCVFVQVFLLLKAHTQALSHVVLACVWLVLVTATVFTAVMPMMSVWGSEGQAFLLWAHRFVALAFTLVSFVWLVCWVRTHQRKMA